MHSSTAAGKLITRVFRQNMYVKKAIRSAYNCEIYMSYLATCNRMNLVCTKIYKKIHHSGCFVTSNVVSFFLLQWQRKEQSVAVTQQCDLLDRSEVHNQKKRANYVSIFPRSKCNSHANELFHCRLLVNQFRERERQQYIKYRNESWHVYSKLSVSVDRFIYRSLC